MGNNELYVIARTILNKWHTDKSWREIAQMLHVPDDKIDSYAAQFNAISRGQYNHPQALIAMQLITPTKKIPTCVECGKVHGRFKTCDDKRPASKRIRISADVTPQQREALHALAEWDGLTWSEYCRDLADEFLSIEPKRPAE